MTLAALLRDIDETRLQDTNLSSAIRIYVLHWIKDGTIST